MAFFQIMKGLKNSMGGGDVTKDDGPSSLSTFYMPNNDDDDIITSPMSDYTPSIKHNYDDPPYETDIENHRKTIEKSKPIKVMVKKANSSGNIWSSSKRR